jgi:hypothetical protein
VIFSVIPPAKKKKEKECREREKNADSVNTTGMD